MNIIPPFLKKKQPASTASKATARPAQAFAPNLRDTRHDRTTDIRVAETIPRTRKTALD
jgi:hypothetical protein